MKNCDATWRDDAEHLLTAPPIKNFSLKIQDGGRPITLERPVLRHHEIFHFVDFQDGGCPSSWNFEIMEIGQTVAELSHFSCFSSEM